MPTDSDHPSGTFQRVPETIVHPQTGVQMMTGRMLTLNQYGEEVDPVTLTVKVGGGAMIPNGGYTESAAPAEVFTPHAQKSALGDPNDAGNAAASESSATVEG